MTRENPDLEVSRDQKGCRARRANKVSRESPELREILGTRDQRDLEAPQEKQGLKVRKVRPGSVDPKVSRDRRETKDHKARGLTF